MYLSNNVRLINIPHTLHTKKENSHYSFLYVNLNSLPNSPERDCCDVKNKQQHKICKQTRLAMYQFDYIVKKL